MLSSRHAADFHWVVFSVFLHKGYVAALLGVKGCQNDSLIVAVIQRGSSAEDRVGCWLFLPVRLSDLFHF